MDIEGISMWPEELGENKSPGVRLVFDSNSSLAVNRKKIGDYSTWTQPSPTPFPRNEWVKVSWKMLLSSDDEIGESWVYQNDTLVLNNVGNTLPDPDYWEQNYGYAPNDPICYERFQVGETASPSNDVNMYVDDVIFRMLN